MKNVKLTLAANELKQPLHVKVRQILRDQILSEFQEGHRFYTEREIMRTLAVSQATTRRALQDLVTEGYLETDPRRGFFVKRREELRYVGLITPTSGSRMAEAHAEYSDVCRRHGYTLDVHGFHKGENVKNILGVIRHKPVEERIIITGLTVELTLELSNCLFTEGYQHVVVGAKMSSFKGGSISMDHDSEVDQILNHLTGLGHERIVFIVNEPKNLLFTSLRSEAVRQKLAERKLTKAQLIFCDTPQWGDSFEAAYKKTDAIMQSKPAPTAIVPLSGVGAWAVMRYAIKHGIKVPQQLAIASFDPMMNADILPVPLTELMFSHEERAEKALNLLWSPQPPQSHELITPKLVVRESTGAHSSR
ncbi:MAG: GntR family transcriptional regulator [Chthoniobacteraceae bacterium]